MAKNVKSDNGLYIYLTIVLVFASLVFSTIVHDPILHSAVAFVNGWEISEWESGMMIGSTSAMISAAQVANTSTFMFWFYFMFPPIFIFIIVLLINIFHPSRLLRISGMVVMALNLASANPEIKGSDAYNAGLYLTTRGWSESTAFGLQYILFFGFIILYGIYLYLITEDNNKDMSRRSRNILG